MLCSLVTSSFDDDIPLYFLHRPIRFEVWDRDNRWNDDLLGRANLIPTMGRSINKKFKLKHGFLFVQLSAVCAPSLQGSLCEQYTASPNYEGMMGYVTEERKDHWGSGRSGPEAEVL